jgi:hypothetical protein
MTLSSTLSSKQSVSRKNIIDLVKSLLPVLRYGLYIFIPFLFIEEFPKYIRHVNPVTTEEQTISFILLTSSLATLGYLILKKIFYNANKYLVFLESTLGSVLLITFVGISTISFQFLGFLVGMSIAANLSHEIARFDSMWYQRTKENKHKYKQTPDMKIDYLVDRIGIIKVKFYGKAIIPAINPSFSQKQALSGYLKSEDAEISENEKEIVIRYETKVEGWIISYFKLKRKVLDKYLVFLNGLDDLMK